MKTKSNNKSGSIKVTRAAIIAEEIQAEIGGKFSDVRAKVAALIFTNPTLTDDEVAFQFIVQA